jgi:hypothetical protein
MANNIDTLRKMEADALKGDGQIDATEARNLAKTAATPAEKKVVREMLAHDNFGAPKKAKDKTELNKLLGGNLPKSHTLAGAEIPGVKGAIVQRVFGEAGGYEDKHHAIAVARAAGSDNAMVVKGKNGRWYAVESNVNAAAAKGASTTVKDVLQVGKVDPATYDALKKKANAATGEARRAAWQEFAAYATGVPKGEVQVNFKGDAPSAGKVNISLDPGFDPEGRVPGFNPNKPEYVELGPKAFDRPANAVSTLGHEEIHGQHYRDTARLYKQYKDSKSKEPFRLWAAHNMKGGGKDPREVMKADIAAGFEDGAIAATELFAHIEAAKISFQTGDLTQARTDLAKVATLATLPLQATQSLAQDELRALRDSLPDGAREVFDEEVAKAKHGVLKGL